RIRSSRPRGCPSIGSPTCPRCGAGAASPPGCRCRRRGAPSPRGSRPAAVLRLARLARGADVLYACTLSSFPYCLLAGRLAGVPSVVHVYSSYGSPRPYRKHLLARARHVVAPSADSLALARAALGEF